MEKYGGAGQDTDGKTRNTADELACWITKATHILIHLRTNKQPENVISIAFLLQQYFRACASVLSLSALPVLLAYIYRNHSIVNNSCPELIM